MNDFDPLDGATEAALRASIRRHGVLVPVAHDQDGGIIDGHHRTHIAGEEGVEFRVDIHQVRDDAHRRELAATLNTDRRHLTAEQRREVVAALAAPDVNGVRQHSPQAIADALKVGLGTVQRDEAQLTRAGNVNPADTVIGKDGKSYSARRPSKPKAAPRENDAENPAVREWVRARRDEGMTRERIAAASKGSERDYPGSRPLSDRITGQILAVIKALDEVAAASPPDAKRRAKNWDGKSNDKRRREIRAQKRNGDYSKLLELALEMSRQCVVIEAYAPDDFGLDDATLVLIDQFHDDLLTLASWVDRGLARTQTWLTEVRVREKITALRATNGRTPEEAETALRLADKLERKLGATLTAKADGRTQPRRRSGRRPAPKATTAAR